MGRYTDRARRVMGESPQKPSYPILPVKIDTIQLHRDVSTGKLLVAQPEYTLEGHEPVDPLQYDTSGVEAATPADTNVRSTNLTNLTNDTNLIGSEADSTHLIDEGEHQPRCELFNRAIKYVADKGGDVVEVFGDADEVNLRWEKPLPEFKAFLRGRIKTVLTPRDSREREAG